MIALLLGLLVAISPPDSSDNLDDCLAIAPSRIDPPITSLESAQEMWTEDPPVPPDTLRSYLARVQEARQCFFNLDSSKISRPYIGNILRTYAAEAELRAGLRQFSKAFAAYEAGLSYLKSRQSPENFAGYEAALSSWPQVFRQNQGYLHYLLGNLSASIKHYLKALRAESKPSKRVGLLIDVGILHQRMQDYRSAHSYFERADRLFRKSSLSPEDHASLRARLFFARADLLLEETLNTDFDRSALVQARDWAERARVLAEPGTPQHTSILVALSESQGYLGNFDAAYRLNREARTSARSREDVEPQAIALLKLGVLHLQTEHWTRAESALNEALTLAEGLDDLDLQRRILRALGRLHEIQEEWVEAEHYYRKGVTVIEKYRESLTASQWSMTAFAQWRDIHRGLVRSLLAQEQPREALAALDRSRARHLQDLRTQARVANQLPPAQRARFDSLTRTLTDVRNRLGQEHLSDREQTELQNREAALMAARQQLLQIDSTAATRPSIAEISEGLARQDRVLVSYFLDDPWAVYGRSPRSAAFVLTGDTLRTVPLPNLTQDSVRAQLEATSPLFTSRNPSNRANAMHFDLRPLYTLQKALYAPVAKYLPEGRPLTIVPSGPLFRIPFSMLVRSMPGGRYAPSEARFLLHERAITVELATSLVADTTRQPRLSSPAAQAKLAAFGISEFDTLRTVPPAFRPILSSNPLDSSLALPNLPGVRSELRSIRRRVEGARIFLDEAATEKALWRTSRRADALHLASHAFFHPSSPLYNAFLLRPDSSAGRGTDGVLFLHELQSRNRPMRLVVLSGCNTARGSRRGGEGMQGLQYAFRAMGTEATLSSLWPVADEANVELTDAFYRYLTRGLRKDQALRRAKLDYLEAHPERASPFFWASTVLYGSPAPLDLNSASVLPPWIWWGLLVGGVVLVGSLLWWGLRVPARRRP